MTVFLDPSMKTIGWCAAEFSDSETRVKEGGRIFSRGKANRLRNEVKIDLMLMKLETVLDKYAPETIVIEIPSGRVHETRHGGGGSGLSVYGFAVGHVRQRCKEWASKNGGEVVGLLETEWTGGHGKQKHELVARRVWPEIAKRSDPGSDIADAVAMAEWWLRFILVKRRKQQQEPRVELEEKCFVCGKNVDVDLLETITYGNRKVQVCKTHFKPKKNSKKGKHR